MAATTSRARRGLVGLMFVLACLGIVFSTIAVWAHQTVLGTDRFVAVTSRVIAEPDVQAAVAQRLAIQVVDAADVQGRIAGVLPENQAFLAIPLTRAVEQVIDRQLTRVLANERAQGAFDTALRIAHERVITLLRGNSDFATIEGGVVTIDLLPIAIEGLRAVQEAGILPASVTLPDVTDPAGRDALIARLESALGRDLPADFALIPIASAPRLAAAQTAVRAFDIAVVVLVLVTIALVIATIALSRRRLRMVVLLGLGAVVALVVARLLVRGALTGLVSSLEADGGGAALGSILRDLTSELGAWTWLLVILGIIVAATAVVAGRPEWVTSGVAAAGAPTSRGDRLEAWVRDHGEGIAWSVGILLAVILLWIALSPEVAILAGIGLAVVGVSVQGRRRGSTDGAGPTAVSPEPG